MSESGRQGKNAMPRLTHGEAERLISARLDVPLPPDQNRVLLAHLAICPSCRAFATRMESMTQGLRELPMLPASPTVSRQVRERITQEQSAWSRCSRWLFAGRWGAMPAMASALALVAIVTFSLILRGDNGANLSRTPIPAASSTDIAIAKLSPSPSSKPTEAPTSTATNTPYVTWPGTEQPVLPNIQVEVTPTPEPTMAPTKTATSTATPDPPETPTPAIEPTEAPSPTGTATAKPSQEPSATTKPTETDVPATDTPIATETPPSEPSETPSATATRTPEPEPTATRTSTPEPEDTPTPTKTPTATPADEPVNTPRPTRTPTLAPTSTPEELPQPTIQPADGNGSAGDDEPETPEAGPDSTTLIELGETPAADEGNGSNLSIQPVSGTAEATGEISTETTGDETPGSTSDTTPGIEPEAGALDDADVLGQIGSDVSAPSGGLRMPVDLGVFVIAGPDGALAVVDAGGNLIQPLGEASQPIWSPLGQVLLFGSHHGELPSVKVWDREEGRLYDIGIDPDESGAVADVPAGWIESRLYYLRSFPGQPGRVELHRADWNGENDELVWSSEHVELNGDRPVTTLDGVLIPTRDSWLFIDAAGNESDFGANSFGYAGDPLLSPFGSLVVYVAGDQLIIAPVTSPGNPRATIPYPDGAAGFAFAPDGSRIVVSDGSALRIYSTDDGSLIGEATGSSGNLAGHPYWAEDGIRFIEIDEVTTLKLVQPDAFTNP